MTNFNIKDSVIGQVSSSGDNVHVNSQASGRQIVWHRLSTAWKFVGTTVGIISGLLAWYAAHVNFGVWFFGMK